MSRSGQTQPCQECRIIYPHLRSSHWIAVLQALLVTLLWSTSWVLIKIGLKDIPALTFAGLRYTLAFGCLLPFFVRASRRESPPYATLRRLLPHDRRRLIVLGLLLIAVAQGTQFLALDRLPAVTVNLLLTFTVGIVALLGIVLLGERLVWSQWGGMGLYLIGVLAYFYPAAIPTRQVIGLIIALICVLANAFSTVLGRSINRSRTISPLTVTTISIGIGSPVLLAAGLITQGLPRLSLQNWAIIGWLAVVNTAATFTLWNHTQRTLSAVESSLINNTMLIQIAVLAWIFLDEVLSGQEILGLILAGTGTLIVQVRRGR